MGRYEERLFANGDTIRERKINTFKQSTLRLAHSSASLQRVKIDGEDREIFINYGTQPYYKEIESLPDEKFYPGQIVEYAHSYWLIEKTTFDDEIYIYGHMTQCNWILKWQDVEGRIIERPVYKTNASSYSTGIEGNYTIQYGSDQAMVLIPYDEDTIKLRRDMRFFIDNDTVNPVPFRLTRRDTVSSVFNGHGYINLLLVEDQYNPKKDNIELGICDYREYDDSDYLSLIDYMTNYIICGYKKGTKFSAKFRPRFRGEELVPIWTLDCDFIDELQVMENGNDIYIATGNSALVGRSFTLNLAIGRIIGEKDGEPIIEKTDYRESHLVLEVIHR